MTMGYTVGIVLALIVCTFARTVGFDRDRAFYPTVLVVIASYYVLFAVMGGSTRALVLESVAMSAFAVFAVAGFKRHLWLVVAALAAHGVFEPALFSEQPFSRRVVFGANDKTLIRRPWIWFRAFAASKGIEVAGATGAMRRGKYGKYGGRGNRIPVCL
jgi:hypothetical protein